MLKTIYVVVGFLMLADALFAWANINKAKPMINRIFPNLNFKLFLWVEAIAGLAILASQLLI